MSMIAARPSATARSIINASLPSRCLNNRDENSQRLMRGGDRAERFYGGCGPECSGSGDKRRVPKCVSIRVLLCFASTRPLIR